MNIPTTEGIGKARWTQGDSESVALEVRIPVTLPEGVRPRDLTVEIKDSTVLCIRHNETRIIQWRLFASVLKEIEWRVENDATMVIDLEKTTASSWASLIDLPIHSEDPLLVTQGDISSMLLEHLPVLPPVKAPAGPLEEVPDCLTNVEEDLDKLLDEAADEVAAGDDIVASTADDIHGEFVIAELKNFEDERSEITTKLGEVVALLEGEDEGDESRKEAENQRRVLEEMLRLHEHARFLRTKPSTLENCIECVRVDIQKARVNIGEFGEEEEEFANDEEKSLTATQLMAKGLELFQNSDIKGCFHFLRLAALHHAHDQSIITLYTIYSQLSSPRGAHMLLERALDDENPSAEANAKIGELFDNGARHFLPLFPVALHFYQRAAQLGSVSAMLAIAQLWQQGSTATSMLSEEQCEALKSIPKYRQWLDKAVSRGCGSAYFVMGCMCLKGEHGMKKSYEQAREYIDAAGNANPEITRRAPQIHVLLDALRREEQEKLNPGSAASSANSRQTKAALDASPQVPASVQRLQALSRESASSDQFGSVSKSKKFKSLGGSAKRKAFWERACVLGVTAYGVFALAFPLRLIALPFVNTLLGGVVAAIPWLGNTDMDGLDF